MNLGTIVGLILGLALMGLASVLGAQGAGVPITSLLDIPSLLIVFGGSLAATAIAFKLSQVIGLTLSINKRLIEKTMIIDAVIKVLNVKSLLKDEFIGLSVNTKYKNFK